MRQAGREQQSGAAIIAHLRERRTEIEQAAIARVYAVSDPRETADPEYMHGLRAAVSGAVEYGLAALDRSEARPPPIPAVLLSQARLAARNRISLDTVLRRYFAGYTLLGDFVIEEARRGAFEPGKLQRLLRAQAELFDRLIAAVASEYRDEIEAKSRSRHQRRAESAKRLLAGELADTSELDYELHDHHLGLLASGAEAEETVHALAGELDRRLLAIPQGDGMLWAWFGGRRPVEAGEIERIAKAGWPTPVSVAIGEPGKGVSGWRSSHRQAAAALPIALRGLERIVRYGEVCLLASILQDEVLVASLEDLYLAPLEAERDGGEVLKETLRAYFGAGRNVSSTAEVIGVKRHTVTNRLRVIEARLGRPMSSCAAEVDAALQLENLGRSRTVRSATLAEQAVPTH